MEPKNKSERTKAFVNFILLLIVSIGIIITTVFFSIDVPIKQANDLRSQIHKVERERVFTSEFLTKMSEIVGMLDSINTYRNQDYLDIKIKESIQNLQIKVDADSVYDKILYQNVVKNMFDLQQAKADLRKLTKTDTDVKELKKANDELTMQYNALMEKYNQRQQLVK